jgi:hypothetical protein
MTIEIGSNLARVLLDYEPLALFGVGVLLGILAVAVGTRYPRSRKP